WAMAGSDRFDPTPLTRQLEHWDILDLSFKPYPCCRWIHTTLDALASLPIPAAEVQSIEVQTISSLARTFTDPAPATMIDAQFSVPYACACLLLAVAHRDWHSSLHDPRVLALAARTRLVEDPEAQTRYLAAGRLSWLIPTRVIVRLADGRVLQNSAEVARGSAGRPLSDTELIAKFQHLVEPSLGEVRTARLADALLNLASLPDVRRLLGRFGR
ncbi:MAG: MmgE/PrpD family protein, partial [Chloroflexota bacterium]|nr:MmgE/PrpD family protein [Chloroflexota bacterium]